MKPTAKYISTSILALLICLIPAMAFSQTEESQSARFENAISLYNNGMYSSAESQLAIILSSNTIKDPLKRAAIEGYLTLISIETGSLQMRERYSRMENLFSESSLMPFIRLEYAARLSSEGDFREAVNVLEKVREQHLPRSNAARLNFEKGLAFFYNGNPEESKEYFRSVTDLERNSLTNPAYYYLAYTNYMTQNFREAILLFGKIKEDPSFTLHASYYIMESRFMLNDFRYVTSHGEALYDKLTGELKSKTARILSESYFALNDDERARFYFERYSLTGSSLSRKDIYFAGILSYRQNKFDEAIELFRQIPSGNDSLSQNASYYLGKCYVETNNKIEAQKSFKIASETDLDIYIQEDAMYNYAKLTFDLNSDISAFDEYLRTFTPTQEKYNEIQNYIASSFILSKDYKSAIQVLQNIKAPASSDILNLQKAAFLRGMQLMELGAYRDAIPVFTLSLENSRFNRDIENLTKFWIAEAFFRDKQYQRSVELNLELLSPTSSFMNSSEYPTAMYNLAYGYFKATQYARAEEWFKRYINYQGKSLKYASEAYARLGDCLFMQKKYDEAATAFSLVQRQNNSLYNYSLFQKAISVGLSGNETSKIEILKELLDNKPAKPLFAETMYELGRTLVQNDRDKEAEEYFNKLNNEFPNTQYHSKALLELGLISLNRGDRTKATGYYKAILEESPESPESQDAIAGLENIYGESGRADEFLAYLDGLGLSETRSASERESLLFSTAEREFISGNYSSAIVSLSSFLDKYPEGEKSSQAWFYLGESYKKSGKPDLALDAFMKVMNTGEGSFTELATLNYARISYEIENYSSAAKAYSSLKRIARLENNIIEAQTGLMNSYYMDKQYRNAIAEAERAMEMEISKDENTRARYIIAKSHYLLGERELAKNFLEELSKDKISEEGAESAYLIISDAFDKGDFPAVEEKVYAFSESGTPHQYWLAKSFILLGDSFAERGNWAQAEATYNSIMESYQNDSGDDILDQLKVRLAKLEEIKKEREDENK
jgi:tetratricopeptide (TPR) repeat protein